MVSADFATQILPNTGTGESPRHGPFSIKTVKDILPTHGVFSYARFHFIMYDFSNDRRSTVFPPFPQLHSQTPSQQSYQKLIILKHKNYGRHRKSSDLIKQTEEHYAPRSSR